MRYAIITLCLLGFGASFHLRPTAAQPAPPPQQTPTQPKATPAPDEQESVVRISTQLVQIDAVVTDKKGEHVTDLNENEIELFVDGKKQPLTFFKLVKVPVRERSPEPNKRDQTATIAVAPPNLSSNTIAPEKVARTIAFVIDDLSLSFESTHYTREALKKFVNQQMEEGDLVGIIRTGRGLGALQQFTSDKRILLTAIDKLTWNPFARNMMPQFGTGGANGVVAQPEETEEQRRQRQETQDRFDDARDTIFLTGTLGAVNFVVRGLRELPGRKMCVLVSDGLTLFSRDGTNNQQVIDNVRRLVDQANRSSVVIYSLDARGLQTLSATAADDFNGMSQEQIQDQRSQVNQQFNDSQDGLTYLARETGGFAMLNNNDLNLGVRKILKDNESYYLLGFDPDDVSFDRKYHNLRLRVTRPGVTARSRKGFFGIPDTAPRPQPKTRDEQILNALYSPFGARDLTMRMTSFFFNIDSPPKTDANVKAKKDKENKMPEGTLTFVRSLLHLEADKFTVTTTPEGK
ncbi:MAG: VWA domain-containing protein, partial [Acidobacteria bacterium]|nr:VWA domain-containing protein [Acidobacteriota bacterium]